MILFIKTLDDAKEYMEQIKKLEFLNFTTGADDNSNVYHVKYNKDIGLFKVVCLIDDEHKDGLFELKDDECVEFIYRHREAINKSFMFNFIGQKKRG